MSSQSKYHKYILKIIIEHKEQILELCYWIPGLWFGFHIWEWLSFTDRPGSAQHHPLLGNLIKQEELGSWLAASHTAVQVFPLRSVTGAQGPNVKCLSCLSLDSLIRSCSSTASKGLDYIWPLGGSFAQAVEPPVAAPEFEWDFCLSCWRWSAPGAVCLSSVTGERALCRGWHGTFLLRQTKENRGSGPHTPEATVPAWRPSQPFYHQLG